MAPARKSSTALERKLPGGLASAGSPPARHYQNAIVTESVDYEPDLCRFNKELGDAKANKSIQYPDVEKELKSATSAGGLGTSEDDQPAAPKSLQQCAEIGRQVFSGVPRTKPRESECLEQSREAVVNC